MYVRVVYYLKRTYTFKILRNTIKITSFHLPTIGRQRKFTHKMVVGHLHWICDHEKQNDSIKRYENFMNLIAKNPQKCIVPTLDSGIHTCWIQISINHIQ